MSRSHHLGREAQMNDHVDGESVCQAAMEPIKIRMLNNILCALPDQAIRRNQTRNNQISIFKEKVINWRYINMQK